MHTRILKRPASSHKSINDSAPCTPKRRSMPWVGEEALTLIGEQDSTGHDIGPRTSKSFSSPEKLDSRILRGYCGAEGFGNLGPFHIKPKAHAEEDEMFKDEQRKSRLLGYTTEDDPVLGEMRSRKGKAHRHQWRFLRVSQKEAQT